MNQLLLSVRNLKISFQTHFGENVVIDTVDCDIYEREVVAFVGESSCGKSVTSLAVTKILSIPPARILSGQVMFEGQDLMIAKESVLRKIRGHDISYIFQEPSQALNPVFSISDQIREVLKIHSPLSKAQMKERIIESLEAVKIPDAASRTRAYPHELSGGMKQRVMIAMALVCEPKLLIADEPTTALDVTVQREIMALLKSLYENKRMSIFLATHDLGVVRFIADRVYVMYAGEIVEEAPTSDLFRHPKHPYTRALLAAMPHRRGGQKYLKSIPGEVPKSLNNLQGCRFAPRCSIAREDCRMTHPNLERLDERTAVRCPYWKS